MTHPQTPHSLALPPPSCTGFSLPGGLDCATFNPHGTRVSAGTGHAWLGEGAAEAAGTPILCPSASRSLAAPALAPAPPGQADWPQPVSLLPRVPHGLCVTEAGYQLSPGCSQPGFQGSCCPLEASLLLSTVQAWKRPGSLFGGQTAPLGEESQEAKSQPSPTGCKCKDPHSGVAPLLPLTFLSVKRVSENARVT